MTNNIDRTKHADTIVRNHVVWSMGAGLIPVLIVDIFAVTAMQMDMIRQLSKLYGNEFSETRGKAIVTALTSSTLARITAGSIAKMIPVVGSFVGGVTVSIFAGATTYALGQVFKKHFEDGGTILDFDVERLRKLYKEQFEKGKKVVKDWKKETDMNTPPPPTEGFGEPIIVEDPVVMETAATETEPATEAKEKPSSVSSSKVLDQLEKLSALRESGAITDAEFKELKKKLIARL